MGNRWRPSGAVQFHTLSLPQKLAQRFSRPGVEATAILATKITWWHGNVETAVALDSNFKLLSMSRILVAVEKMVSSCYNRDQTWLCVYCWCQTPSGVVSLRAVPLWSPGLARHYPWEFDTNKTHTIMFDPLIPAWISNYMPGKVWGEITYPFLNFNQFGNGKVFPSYTS